MPEQNNLGSIRNVKKRMLVLVRTFDIMDKRTGGGQPILNSKKYFVNK